MPPQMQESSVYARNVGISLTETWKQLKVGIQIFLHLAVLGVWFHATFIKYRLNQIVKSNCVSDGSEMKIMIQWVTQSHSSMGLI